MAKPENFSPGRERTAGPAPAAPLAPTPFDVLGCAQQQCRCQYLRLLCVPRLQSQCCTAGSAAAQANQIVFEQAGDLSVF